MTANRVGMIVAALVVGVFGAARADPRPAPLSPFDPAQLATLGPMLTDRDVVVIELDDRGHLKQLTTLTLVAAAPDAVHEVVVHPERYADFVRNMKRSRVAAEPGGTLWHEYAISYHVYTVEGHHRYVFVPKAASDAVAPVEMYDPDGDGTRHYRWEFVPAAGGATVLALYGYTEIAHDRFTSRYLNQAPTLESGFALIPQLTLLYSMKSRAQELSGGRVALPAAGVAAWDFLLARGTVAVLLSSDGRLREVNVVERSKASPEALLAVAADPARWSSFVPTMRRSTPIGAGVEIEQSLPLMNWTTRWAYRQTGAAVDLFGIDGDLQGAHLRWDVVRGGAGTTQLALRAAANFQNGSTLLREVYKLEPYLEYGFDVALNLLLLQSLRHRAEALATP